MINFLKKIIKPRYDTLNRVEIKADKIIANFRYLQSCQPGAAIFPVLKSNAYGHGLKEMCQILNRTEAPLVIVDSFPEAQIVYRYFRGHVLILGEMPLKAYDYCRFERTEFVVYNGATLQYLSRFGKRARLHLFFNSGMNREGIQDMAGFISRYRADLEKVNIQGFASHLASAETDSALNAKQEARFFAALKIVQAAGFQPRWVHLGNSAYLLKQATATGDKASPLTAYRSGLALYGYSPFQAASREARPLQPALEIFSRVVAIQEVAAGDSVSYNETYRLTKASRLAIIPFGYFEGLDRRLANQGQFLITHKTGRCWAPVAGAVSMNLSCLDVGHACPVGLGDEVKILSSQTAEPNSLLSLAQLIGTIPYEVLVKIQANIRRIIV